MLQRNRRSRLPRGRPPPRISLPVGSSPGPGGQVRQRGSGTGLPARPNVGLRSSHSRYSGRLVDHLAVGRGRRPHRADPGSASASPPHHRVDPAQRCPGDRTNHHPGSPAGRQAQRHRPARPGHLDTGGGVALVPGLRREAGPHAGGDEALVQAAVAGQPGPVLVGERRPAAPRAAPRRRWLSVSMTQTGSTASLCTSNSGSAGSPCSPQQPMTAQSRRSERTWSSSSKARNEAEVTTSVAGSVFSIMRHHAGDVRPAGRARRAAGPSPGAPGRRPPAGQRPRAARGRPAGAAAPG